jgi:hypothetical protein
MRKVIIGFMTGVIFTAAIIAGSKTMTAAAEPAPINATMSTYTETDPDFLDDNYKEANRLGDTDFFGFRKANGETVILEEDMKWTISEPVDLEAMTARLESFDQTVEAIRTAGGRYDWKSWMIGATEAIEGK